MYTPTLRVKNNGVPVLSKKELNDIGERFIADFQPEALKEPQPIDIDGFAELYLGMTPDYQYLSHNGIYLGMTIFNDTNRVVVYDPATNKADYISAKARTMIIDRRLLDESQQHRYRFTVGHEVSHDILHSGYFSYSPDQLTLFDNDTYGAMIQCRVDSANNPKTDTRLWDDHDWMEWQANNLSSAILMPKSSVDKVAKPFVRSAEMDYLTRLRLVNQVSAVFDVSVVAATIRLKDLRYIDKSDTGDYNLGFPLFSSTSAVSAVTI